MYRLILILFFIIYSVCLFGQIELGGKVGYHYGNMAKEIGSRPYGSFVFGITSSWRINNKISINSDLIFDKRGYIVDKGIYDIEKQFYKDCKVILNYIDIPILLGVNVNKYLSVELGPYFGLQVDRNLYYNGQKQNKRLLGNKQPLDLGLLLGIKGKYKGVFIEALYQKGFTQAFKNVKGFYSTGIYINTGYTFNLK